MGTFHIGRGSGLGVGSIAKYDSARQALRIGKFVVGGMRLRFLLNGQHDIRTISTCMFSVFGDGSHWIQADARLVGRRARALRAPFRQ